MAPAAGAGEDEVLRVVGGLGRSRVVVLGSVQLGEEVNKPEDALRIADQRMYEVKRSRRTGCRRWWSATAA